MYAWIWRQLPGRCWLRACQALALVIGAAVACCTWGFPLVDRYVGGNPNIAHTVQAPTHGSPDSSGSQQ